ncbi:MAG: hypothetical protein HN909_09145 [Phycisphaerales bacterium]|nr:hypothetical protein [Phycisphaerales bacterium]MBT7171915.1 hypothetical protein [Phycisphaerales bacterium]
MNRVRGFAVTLGLGVMFSMFTALVVTRWSFAALTKMGLLKNRITMLRIFPKFNINWMTKRYMFWGISLAFMVMGITSLLSVGRGVFGVEFSAGAKVTVVFNDDTLIDGKLPTDELVRSKFLGDNGAVATYLADLTKELQTEQPKLDAELKTRTAEATALKTKVDAAKAAYDKAQTTIETARKQKTDSAVSDEERSNLSQQFQELEGQYGDLMTSIRTRKERLATLQADIASCKELRLARITTAPETLYVHTILSAYAKNGADVVTKAAWTKAGKSVAWFDGADTNKDSNLDRAELEYLVDNHPASYRVSTSVTNAALIRRVLTHAFGNHLKTRPACSFDFVASKAIPTLGLVASDTGVTQVTDAVETTLKNDYSQVEYTALNNAHVMAVDNVKPKLTVAEMTKRINDIRLQPDFKDASMNPCDVIPVGKLANRYDSFLVLVKPASTQSFDAAARKAFATLERSVLTESLQREEAMVASVHDASYASKTVNLTIIVIVLSWAAIVFYLWLRFGSLQWGLAAVVCLIHDVMIVVGLIAASHWLGETGFGKSLGIDVFKIDLPMVAAILTVIGYSVNDTIVVFDRIRENRGKRNYVTAQCINSSINQTLPRTVLTSLTTLIVLLSMYILGGGVIKSYSFALIAGILFGTYSSVAVASPLLLGFRHALVADMSDANKEEPAGE